MNRRAIHSQHRFAPGVTLLEMLAVMAIIAMMFGLTVTVYIRMSKSFKEQGAAADVDVAIRQARSSAISGSAPAFVAIDVKNRSVVPWVYRTVGCWHFEDRTGYGKSTGAYHPATLRGAQLFNDGKIGKCARIGEGAFIDVGSDPDFDLQDGGYLEAYIRPATYTFNGDNFIFYKQNAYFLKIGLYGIFSANAGGVTIKTTNYHAVPGRWTKVAFAWDSQSTRILIDDAVVAAGPGAKPQISDYPLLIGHETAGMEGLVDEVRVMTVSVGNAVHLPPDFILTHTAAPWNAIYFSPDGNLDPRYHAGPVSVTITANRRVRAITVSPFGQVTRAEMDKLPPEEKPEVLAGNKPAATSQRSTPANTALTLTSEQPASGNKTTKMLEPGAQNAGGGEEPNVKPLFGLPVKKQDGGKNARPN